MLIDQLLPDSHLAMASQLTLHPFDGAAGAGAGAGAGACAGAAAADGAAAAWVGRAVRVGAADYRLPGADHCDVGAASTWVRRETSSRSPLCPLVTVVR